MEVHPFLPQKLTMLYSKVEDPWELFFLPFGDSMNSTESEVPESTAMYQAALKWFKMHKDHKDV